MSETKTIVITGASGGIGAALAALLGKQGHKLVLAARRTRELEAVAKRSGPHAIAVTTDVSRREDILRLRDKALETFQGVDVWINNAGRGITKPVLELTDADVQEMMQVNVMSALYGMQAIAPHFIQRKQGHIINVSSFLGRVPAASFRSAYSAAKAALNSLTTNLRMDLLETAPAIRVSLIMPGMVDTDFARNSLGGLPKAPPTHMKAQSVDEVARQIVEVIANPVDELYTNAAAPGLIRKFYSIG